jgi:transposase InsO family protein
VYPNLTRNFVPTARNQLWVADITYIRLAEEFIYLAVLDAYSRLVIGWALERTLEAKLALGALQMALDKRGASAALIHHSDRGVQYACGDYTQLLQKHGLRISMSRKANPYDNAKAESFMKTLKHEEVHRVEYRDLAEARRESATSLNGPTTASGSIPHSVTVPQPSSMPWRFRREFSKEPRRSINPRSKSRGSGRLPLWPPSRPAHSVSREVAFRRFSS